MLFELMRQIFRRSDEADVQVIEGREGPASGSYSLRKA